MYYNDCFLDIRRPVEDRVVHALGKAWHVEVMHPLFSKIELMIAKTQPQLKFVPIRSLKSFHLIKSIDNQ